MYLTVFTKESIVCGWNFQHAGIKSNPLSCQKIPTFYRLSAPLPIHRHPMIYLLGAALVVLVFFSLFVAFVRILFPFAVARLGTPNSAGSAKISDSVSTILISILMAVVGAAVTGDNVEKPVGLILGLSLGI